MPLSTVQTGRWIYLFFIYCLLNNWYTLWLDYLPLGFMLQSLDLIYMLEIDQFGLKPYFHKNYGILWLRRDTEILPMDVQIRL